MSNRNAKVKKWLAGKYRALAAWLLKRAERLDGEGWFICPMYSVPSVGGLPIVWKPARGYSGPIAEIVDLERPEED